MRTTFEKIWFYTLIGMVLSSGCGVKGPPVPYVSLEENNSDHTEGNPIQKTEKTSKFGLEKGKK